MKLDVRPGHASNDAADAQRADAERFRNRSLRLAGGSTRTNLAHALLIKLGLRIGDAFRRAQPGLESVLDVSLESHPFEVTRRVVQFVAIAMVHGCTYVLRLSMPSKGDKAVHIDHAAHTLLAQVRREITPQVRQLQLTLVDSARKAAKHLRPLKRLDSAICGGAVEAFESRNWLESVFGHERKIAL